MTYKILSNNRTLKTILSIGLILIASCKEFIELPVTEKKIALRAPVDSLETNKYNLLFWWDMVDDATAYRLQLVNPNFNKVSSLILDTLIKKNKFTYTFEPGNYQWRVRAENGSSQGLYTTRNFIVHESSLDKQQVLLNSPLNSSTTNNADIIYKWQPLYSAKNYVVEIDTNNFIDEKKVIVKQRTSQTQYSNTLSKSKTYQWRVRAENESDTSRWSPVYSFIFDRNSPDKVELISPADNQTVTSPVSLRWNSVNDAFKYELIVFKSDKTTIYSGFPISLTNTNYSLTIISINEKLYWKVRAKDQARNAGVYSNLHGFTVQ